MADTSDYNDIECGACLMPWDKEHERFFTLRMAAGVRYSPDIRWQACQKDRPLAFEMDVLNDKDVHSHPFGERNCTICHP